MEENQNVRKLLLRRVAVATGAGLLAVVAGVGMAPAGAAELSAEAQGEAEGTFVVTSGHVFIDIVEIP